jgi:DNA-binding NarL/FixJ family response regulator
MIRVALIDDQTLIRQGIRSLLDLTPHIRVAVEASDGAEAISVLSKGLVDVALLDVRMPRGGGLDVLARLAGRMPPTILLTTFEDDAVAREGVRLGARGFLLKDVSCEQLVHAITEVAQGRTLVSPVGTERVARGIARAPAQFPASPQPEALTRRELEVVRWMAVGSSNREIAEVLGAAEGTVKNHASSIFAKLGVRDRTRAVLKAIALGYL